MESPGAVFAEDSTDLFRLERKEGEHMHNRTKWWRWAAYLGVIACTLFIWHNSLMPATESSAQSMSALHHLEGILKWLGLPVTVGHSVLRKLAHMTEFALLGMLWETALILGRRAKKSWYSMQSACTLCLLTAMVDETIQVFVPGRGSQVTDVWIDVAGACLGVLVIACAAKFRAAKEQNRAKQNDNFI